MDIARLTPEVFDSLRSEWNDLLARSASNNLFLRWEWIHTWWTVFKTKRPLFILTARRDGRLVGIAPLYIDQASPWGIRTLKLCSDELAPDYMDIIVENNEEAQIVRELVNGILQRANEWDLIDFDNLRTDSALLKDDALFHGYVHTVRQAQPCPYIEIKGHFDDYYRSRIQLRRFDLAKKSKKLREQMNLTHILADSDASVSKGLDDLFALHEKRAAGRNIQSNFISADVKRFHHELSHYLLEERILKLQLLYQGETPVSAIYAFQYKNKVYVYQTGFEPEWSQWSVGGVMFYLGIQKAFEEGLEEYDFLKGTESYKSLWATGQHHEMHLTVYNKTVRGMCQCAGSRLKAVLRKLRSILTGM